ncbi:MAG: cupredoxin domain-containing protein [Chloroflexi bacterium]|nr:cupredoxin domain-containing protein [Chloroflexota bacterium]
MTSERQSSHRRSLALAGLAATALVVLLATAALADSPAPGSPAPGSPQAGASGPPSGGSNAISIVQKTFQPSTLTVHVGDTVTWTVTEAISDPHSVTSGTYKDAASSGKDFDSGVKLKNNGDSFSHTFDAAGTFAFFCAVHPDTMSGTITVVDASGSAGGEAGGGIPVESKLLAAGILVVVLVLLFGWASVYRRMNPGH